jgi:tetratricopeptide (TPR) repeat protein
MKSDRDRPDDALLPELDSEPGPMPQLSAAESDAVAWSVVSRWAAQLPGVEPADGELGPAQPLNAEHAERLVQQVVRRRRANPRLGPHALRAAAAVIVCTVAGASFAAYHHWPALRGTPDRAAPAAKPAASAHVAKPETAPPPVAGSQPSAATATKPATKAEGPEELLARANALRAERRWAAAERAYRKVLSAGASEQQRYVALVAAASLTLQHLGKPAHALALYRSALTLVPKGDLTEEAEFGVAECYRTLGDTTHERAALDRFASDHPDSWLIDGVRRRLAELPPP